MEFTSRSLISSSRLYCPVRIPWYKRDYLQLYGQEGWWEGVFRRRWAEVASTAFISPPSHVMVDTDLQSTGIAVARSQPSFIILSLRFANKSWIRLS